MVNKGGQTMVLYAHVYNFNVHYIYNQSHYLAHKNSCPSSALPWSKKYVVNYMPQVLKKFLQHASQKRLQTLDEMTLNTD